MEKFKLVLQLLAVLTLERVLFDFLMHKVIKNCARRTVDSNDNLYLFCLA